MAKRCNKCFEYREISEYQRDKRNSDGLQGICSPCKNLDKQKRRIEREAKSDYIIKTEKTCNKCNTLKKIDEFFTDKAMADGKGSICKECKTAGVYAWREKNKDQYNQSQRAYQAAHPEMRYGVEIKRRYGCTLEQYNEMLIAQNGKCVICDTLHNPVEKKGRLYVDHCHKTGKVRALLCGACNSMLGYAKDDTRVLAEAIAYLVKHKEF